MELGEIILLIVFGVFGLVVLIAPWLKDHEACKLDRSCMNCRFGRTFPAESKACLDCCGSDDLSGWEPVVGGGGR